MRIQHNIMAMSAYRNYNTNTSAVAKNLEKLSSGYKINRAGDDAAGLAISEKMRAQITGLNAAQKNVKDGISLVKTAEGAMQEIQDMLNRMDYLATQSANGTYDNEVDRAALQKEVEQLKAEINRIADSANFNGIKLLDGSLDTGATEATTTWAEGTEIDIGTAVTTHAPSTNVEHALHKEGVDRQEPSFTVDLTNVEYTADQAGAFKITIGGQDISISTKDGTAGGTALAAGDKLSGKELATAIANAVNAMKPGAGVVNSTDGTANSADMTGIQIGDNVYKAEVDGNNVKFVLQTDDNGTAFEQELDTTNPVIPQAGVTFDPDGNGSFKGLDAGGHANTEIVVGYGEKPGEMAHATIDLAGKIKDGTMLTIGDQSYVFQVGKDSKVTSANAPKGAIVIDLSDVDATDAKLVDKAIAAMTQQTGNTGFRFESGATGKLTMVEKESYAGEADLSTTEGLKSCFKISQMTYTPGNAGDESKALQLQIGDTSDSYNQLKVKVGDMHTAAMGIADLNIGNQDDAAAAIQTIRDAINYVSGVRGDLGATQNRLEHTANNLSVMAENIQDAESTIRDTDVAEEMMAYTKNNILVQSAQAMLAQANQVPQGVLQLLG